jgi:hypothetical protein
MSVAINTDVGDGLRGAALMGVRPEAELTLGVGFDRPGPEAARRRGS